MILQGAASATAQTVYGRPDTILVTPTGEILDYVPEAGEVTVARDRRGRRVLIDHFGNVVATEVPRGAFNGGGDAYTQPPAGAPRGYSQRGYPDQGPAGWNDPRGGYPDYRQYRGNEPGAVTGSIPRDTSVTRLPLDANGAIVDDEQQEASLEQDRVQPLPQPTIQPRNDRPVMAITNKAQAEVVALQVFLDRQGISPGVIDGRLGDNVNKAVAAWQEMTGETLDPNNSEDIMQRLTYSGGLPFTTYTITPADAAGPYVAAIPEDYAHKSQLPAMSYTSVTEALAERFHMDEGYLKALNPGVDFTIPGTIVKVVNPGPPKTGEVVRVVADKAKKQVFAYGADGKLLAAYPATIGSTDTPSPTGTHTVVRVALNPGYTYNPKINFKQGANDKILQIPPGPNGPVGTVWIALSKPTYGIHGTPDPSKIGKTNSHGCIRLTNWDATELAKMVKPGTVVEFVD
ncbi:L,D-transpeptidase [Rhizobium sp. RU35A]|uniref:L,D-transpeptidase family protein n=1 Tax=Rhizobium sp. RU35A TaxID=1907414 RepID=UPI001FCE516D|nr:L,D-transpeptidase [Rhizobium sp. RU35A]